VPNSAINAKVLELILLITSMDNLKLVAFVGFAVADFLPIAFFLS